ncbi:hypothetical protein DK419_13205 [Methylobacterium terrae]|uniref:Uncharacterized protein n=1 Tax=Methylobacterium terrae TaxID=2202827 RepID=A0A2U8WLN2_9HYPH|nr:hypothetical protein [Methylobacterium terrae]AWN47154.1 hypothetical protein DK419_13205 [Methylobacterium terrae]
MPDAKTPRERRSQIARHPDRLAIELSRIAGVSLDRIAAKYGVHRDAIARHMASLPDDYKAALAADVPLEELAARAAKEGGSLLDHFGIIRMTVMQQLLAAAACNDRHATANLARAATDVSREIGRLTGDILNTPTVTNITNQAVIFMGSPFMANLEAMLIRRLAPHPAALRDVMEGLAELQGDTPDGPDSPPPVAPPRLIDARA